MQYKRGVIIVLISAILLLIPLVAMLFTSEVNWTLSDFIVAGILLIGTGLICEFTIRKLTKPKYRIVACIIILIIFILIWGELAVGIFGTPFSGN
jgi:hypothetical protein